MIYLIEGTVKYEERVMFLVEADREFEAAQKVRNGKEFLRYPLETKDVTYPKDFVFHGTFHQKCATGSTTPRVRDSN